MAAKIAPTSYDKLVELCSDGKVHTIGHNTTAFVWSDPNKDVTLVMIKYHGNTIARIGQNLTTLYNCGFFTPTTKDRLNLFIPQGYRIVQRDGVWLILDTAGMTIGEFSGTARFMNGKLYEW